ncbi:hypothetical protein KPL70_007481 [Citrus sinensis]|nr:hypothetical protein KPL70_007481 [Citrus sinensis]
MANECPSRSNRRVKQRAGRSLARPPPIPEFERVHFSSASLPRSNLKEMLAPWETALNLEEKVYPNLVRICYSNIEFSAIRLDQIVTYVGGIPIEFIVEDLNSIIGTDHVGLELYTSGKEIQFSRFSRVDAVRNICGRRDLSDDICSLPFRSQLLYIQIRILHSIFQHIVTPRKGHNDEVTHLDVGLLDYLLRRRPVNLGYIILRHMLSTPAVNNKLFPYGSIIIRILRHFRIPITEPVYDETKRLGGEIILGIGFHRRARPRVPCRTTIAHAEELEE